MSNLVLLSDERLKKEIEGKEEIVTGLKELLCRAENGELRGICYAGIGTKTAGVSLGVLQTESCGLHELVGAAHILNDLLLKVCRD